jgi:hypothetical protein
VTTPPAVSKRHQKQENYQSQIARPFYKTHSTSGFVDAPTEMSESFSFWMSLMVIGEDLAYPDLYAGLQDAENALHRQVNPSFLSPQDWRRKLARKSPFITSIKAQPKIFIFSSEDDLQT